MLLSFTFYNLVYLDQVMAGLFLGREALGIYVLAQYAGTALLLLPQALAVAMGPRLLTLRSRPATRGDREHTWRPTRALSMTLPPLIVAIGWWRLPSSIGSCRSSTRQSATPDLLDGGLLPGAEHGRQHDAVRLRSLPS